MRIKLPTEREWLGRDTISELERCWRYINGVTGDKLPRLLIEVVWDNAETSTDFRQSTITVGMASAAAAKQMKSFLMHQAAREMARLGLAELSRGGSQREENRFLEEGMAEIIAHEYDGSTRALTGAWVLAHFMDRLKLLGIAAQSSESNLSGRLRDLRSAAPGVTFLMTCRELYGRERALKLFEALRKEKLQESLVETFRTAAATLESAWLKKVREYRPEEDVTATSDDDVPALRKVSSIPAVGRPGAPIQLQLHIDDNDKDLSSRGVFLVDEVSGLVIQGRSPASKGESLTLIEIPIDGAREPGKYSFRAVAVDESGNIRHWRGSYVVER